MLLSGALTSVLKLCVIISTWKQHSDVGEETSSSVTIKYAGRVFYEVMMIDRVRVRETMLMCRNGEH